MARLKPACTAGQYGEFTVRGAGRGRSLGVLVARIVAGRPVMRSGGGGVGRDFTVHAGDGRQQQ